MEPLISALIIIGLFLVRIAIPLAITLTLAYLLKRLDARWEAEARAQQQAQMLAETQPDKPASLPWLLPIPLSTAQDVFGQPCWDIKDCSASVRASCPAFAHPDTPCWYARWQVEGHIPKECYHCELFASIGPPELHQPHQQSLYH